MRWLTPKRAKPSCGHLLHQQPGQVGGLEDGVDGVAQGGKACTDFEGPKVRISGLSRLGCNAGGQGVPLFAPQPCPHSSAPAWLPTAASIACA